MAHVHSVYDSDNHFSIDPITRVIVNESSTKNTVVQNDHNSERFTFELPRYIEGHDMSVCDRVEVHYLNIEAVTQAISSGVYEVDDLQISPADSKVVICSWLISNNATKYEGVTSFLIRFACTTDGDFDYVWNTAVYSDIIVSKGIYNSEITVENYADILAQWHRDLFEAGGNAVVNVKDAETNAIAAIETAATAKEQEVLNNIPDDYQTLDANVTDYKKKVDGLANAIKGKVSGAVVRADDVSPVEHGVCVCVYSKNLFDISKLSNIDGKLTNNNDGTLTIAANQYAVPTGKKISELCPSLNVGDVCTLSFVSTSAYTKYVWLNGANEMLYNNTYVFTEEMINSELYFYGFRDTDEDYGSACTISDIQIEKGTTPTEYTPYVDPASVTVTKCGKNIVEITGQTETIDGVTFTVNDDGSVTVNGTAENNVFYKVGKINLAKNGRFFLSGGVENSSVTTYMLYLHDVKTYFDFYDYGSGKAFTPTGGTCDVVIAVYKGATANNIVFYPMVEAGETKTKFEKFEQLTTYTPTTDGTILDMTSLSPTITLLTDTEGAVVECEYNRDSNAVIADLYNKIAELSATT